MTEDTERATILSLHIKDFQGIRVAKLDNLPEYGVIAVQGPVGAGKSSILKAIEAALGGKAHVHARAVHDDAENGFSVDVELTNGYRIDRHSTPSDPKGTLSVVGPDGGKHGQGTLDGFVGALSFDPLSFMRLSHEKKSAIVLALDPDTDRSGRIDDLRAKRTKLTDKRTPFNSELLKIRQMKAPEGDRPEAVDVSATSARLKELGDIQKLADASKELVKEEKRKYHAAVQAVDIEVTAVDDAVKSLALAKESLKEAETKFDEAAASISDAEDVVTPDADADEIATLEQTLGNATDAAEALVPWTEWDRAMERREVVTEQSTALTKLIEANQAEEVAEFSAIDLPINGLEVDPRGEVLWKGRPLSLASGGESISIAVAIAFAVNPTLKLCLLDEANNIGQPQMEALHEAAVKRGFQLWACRLEGSGTITVADGVATQ